MPANPSMPTTNQEPEEEIKTLKKKNKNFMLLSCIFLIAVTSMGAYIAYMERLHLNDLTRCNNYWQEFMFDKCNWYDSINTRMIIAAEGNGTNADKLCNYIKNIEDARYKIGLDANTTSTKRFI